MIKKYLVYLLRWQLSTPLLAVCLINFAVLGPTMATVVGNLIGGVIFFWIDRWIFNHTGILRGELWEVCSDIECADCGKVVDRGYRLVKAKKYDRTDDRRPEFRCQNCSAKKYDNVIPRAVATSKMNRAAAGPPCIIMPESSCNHFPASHARSASKLLFAASLPSSMRWASRA